MGSKWMKVKRSIGMNMCVFVPKTLDDASPSDNNNIGGGERLSDASSLALALSPVDRSVDSRFLSPTTPTPSSQGLKLTKIGSRSSKKTCAICLGTMKAGHGHALFTAECSHAFHFHCIASNVKHGNQICPVCRAKWKEVPFEGPQLDPLIGRARISPVDFPQDDNWTTVLRRLPPPRTDSNRHITSLIQAPEPSIFNDDEPLDQNQHELPSNCSSTRDPIEKMPVKTIEIQTFPEVSAVTRSISQDKFAVLIHLKAPVTTSKSNPVINQMSQNSRTPVDLVTVLDVSGSMAGTKLALLKRAMGFVIQNLGPSDRLSVIAFSSTSRRLFHLRRMTDSGRQQALQAVNSLVSNGGTNIAEGLRKAAKVMEERIEKNPVSSIILLSDGQDTYTVAGRSVSGPRPDYQSLLPSSASFQIPVHTFGFGSDHDAASMHAIAENSGGTFSFIEAEGVIQDAFAQCIGGLLSVVVKDLRVGIQCLNPDIHLGPLKAGSYSTEMVNDLRTGFICVGDLYADEERDFLIYVNVPVSDSSNVTALVKVHCKYKCPVSNQILTGEGEVVKIQRPEVVTNQVVSIDVDRQRNRVQAAEAIADARTAAELGDLAGAVSVLENCRKVLSETTSARSGDRLCAALDAELKEMQERMATRRTYEASGRAYVLSGLSSHSWQRATARGDSTDSTSLVHSYQTPSMVDLVTRSQTMLLARPLPQPPVRVPRSLTVQLQPR
ncbi:hypothetical protein GIB67_027612 [Kingdonia uniflora]|uniref:Uncharacterized protein n=1 Tax=Kingdonia uniflora TaxID=39325 RepID=A0A7J7NLG5_9MAGN|nr:hypothetical protein GIB67_027612 [Kingdonia uniflora]